MSKWSFPLPPCPTGIRLTCAYGWNSVLRVEGAGGSRGEKERTQMQEGENVRKEFPLCPSFACN